MRVAVIGAGAAGLVAAWRLQRAHEVSVFERAPMVGGHVRTLGGNVEWDQPIRLDAGVIEFDLTLFPTVARVFDELGVGVVRVPGTTTLFPERGARWFSPGSAEDAQRPWLVRTLDLLRLQVMHPAWQRLQQTHGHVITGMRLGEVLGDDVFGRWLKLLTMYAYSVPFEAVSDVSAALAVPMLERFVTAGAWVGVEGGTFAYQQRILERLREPVRCNQAVRVSRVSSNVIVHSATGDEVFDAVVIAVPPHRVLDVLADPDADEVRRFLPFHGHEARVLVHGDDGPYARRGATYASEFDVFELGAGRGGYNARLDRLCAVPADWPERPGLAFGLDDEIDPAKVYARVTHDVAMYDVPAMAHKAEVAATQGWRQTWYAGAWLGDGLHEGAFVSALQAAEALGA